MSSYLHKAIILADWHPSDKERLQTVVMETRGMKVCSVLYIDDAGSIKSDKDTVKANLKSELYSDMYDDDLKIKVKEAFDGKDAIKYIVKYLDKIWDEELQVYFYRPDEDTYELLQKKIEETNGRIYMDDYHSIFSDKRDIAKDIKEIMRDEGLKMENLIDDSQLSFVYYLTALVERLNTR